MPNPTKKRYKGQKDVIVEEPVLGMLMSSGEVKIEPEKGRLHQHVWGEWAVERALARFRYDPSDKTLEWTDRDSARDPDIFFTIVSALERRGWTVERNKTLGGGIMRSIPNIASFNLRRFNGTPVLHISMVSPDTARKLKTPVELPKDKRFDDAVKNTKGAEVTPDGLMLTVLRRQHPDQGERQSLRDGVFYQPEGSLNKFPFNGQYGYGGSEKLNGISLFKRPLFIKGAVGGKAVEAAYNFIKGKGAFGKMRSDLLQKLVYNYGYRLPGNRKRESIYEILREYGGNEGVADEIYEHSLRPNVSNGMMTAIMENIIANTVRKAGYDSIMGWSVRRDGSTFISEVFDLRERTYPSQFKPEGEIHPDFSN